ncbi:MAG TPA: hypothetical protein VF082_12790 [Jiangellaceae bacterium]
MKRPPRDPATGKLNFSVHVEVHLNAEPLPVMFVCANWAAVRAFLAGPEFKRMAGRVDFVSLHNQAGDDG